MTTIKVEGKKIVVAGTNYADRESMKAIPGMLKWNAITKCWEYQASPAVAGALARACSNSEIDQAFRALLDQYLAIEQASEVREAVDLPPIPHTRLRPWLHQLRAYHFAYNMPGCMLALDMGCGKTKVTIDLIVNRGHERTLIICPKSVVSVWPKEFDKHVDKTDVDIAVLPLSVGTVEQRAKQGQQFLRLCKMRGQQAVVVINYEASWREAFAGFSMTAGFGCLVLDESHRIKDAQGKASKFCAKLGEVIPYRLALTGTPMPHSPLDIFSQYRVLDPGIFGRSYYRFKQRYAVLGGYMQKQITGFRYQDELQKKFYSIAFRVGKEVLDLPPAVHITRTCELTPAGRRAYKQLENDFVAEVGAGLVTASNALSRLLRLQQLTGGFLRNDLDALHQVDTAKGDLLADVISDIDKAEPLVIFCRFHEDLNVVWKVAEAAGRSCGELSGRNNHLHEWQEGELNTLAVQIQAGGVGIDLTRARYCIYYSLGYSLGDYEQSLARVHRPGQTRETCYIHLLAENTIDEQVMAALEKRRNVVEQILGLAKDRAA